MLKQPKGYLTAGLVVNHSNGLQPYPPNQKCQWKIQYPTAKFISFTFNYLSVGVGGSNDDHLMICQSDSSPSQCTTFRSNGEDFDKTFKLTGLKAYVKFISGDRVAFESRGWELSYSAGKLRWHCSLLLGPWVKWFSPTKYVSPCVNMA